MQWAVTTPPASALLTISQLTYHLRLDSVLAASATEQAYVLDLLAAATEYAEEAMQASLITRTITATYYFSDGGWGNNQCDGFASGLVLPRGPVIALSSVTNGDTTSLLANATLTRTGTTDLLILPTGWSQPLTVVYTAGYTTDPTQIPADIRQAVRVHVGSMYENRESAAAGVVTPVPHSLEDFYMRKCRVGVFE